MFTLASHTLKSIDDCMEADQGAAYRQALQTVLPHMADAYRGAEPNPYRKHLGASVIGQDCPRAIWYGFRWFTKPKFPARIIRLFNRGHLEEARFISMLLSIGCQVYQHDGEGKQFRISDVGGHFGGSGDGVAIGIPDVPVGVACLLEFKTHNDKSFQKMVKEGVRNAKYEHYIQMNIYMRKMGIPVALYAAVNKNDDAIHMEIIHLDSIIADQFLDRAKQIIMLQVPPKKINESPGWYGCSYCAHKGVCHLGKEPERNCRTCYYSRPNDAGEWVCTKAECCVADAYAVLSEADQLAACQFYVKL